MQLDEFTIELESDGDGSVHAQIHAEHYGDRASEEPVTLQLDVGDIEGKLAEIDKGYLVLIDPERAGERDLPGFLEEQRRLGQDLHRSIFHGTNRDVLLRCLGQLDSDRKRGLRIQIACHTDDRQAQLLAGLPWELVNDGGGMGFLAQSLRYPISRQILGLGPVGRLEVEGPLRVLLVEANPEAPGLGRIEAGPEREAIRQVLGENPAIELFEEKPDLEAVRDMIRRQDIHVLHFMGHGGFQAEEGWAQITFADDDNRPVRHRAEHFARELAELGTLRLVVLTTCYGATLPRRASQDVFGAIAPALLRHDVPAVVAMQFPISNSAATELSRRFYTCVAQGDPVDVATAEARRAVSKIRDPKEASAEWPLPAVYLRVRNGAILLPPSRVGASAEKPVGKRSPGRGLRSSVEGVLKVGVRSFAQGHAEGLERRVDRFLGLEGYFVDRKVEELSLWNSVVRGELIEFLQPLLPEPRPIRLEVLAHTSLAFTAGWVLPAKTSLDVRFLQRIPGRKEVEFSPRVGEVPEGPLWNLEQHDLDSEGSDVALAVSLTHDNGKDVLAYLEEKRPEVGRLLHAFVSGGIGHHSVKSGAHAFALAQRLAQISKDRTVEEQRESLHVFLAAPNAFSFFLGQVSHTFGRMQLYEFPFGRAGQAGVYWPSITLPPEGAGSAG